MSAGNKNADETVSDALLEKLRTHAAKPQEAGDALRTITAKIHARVTSSGTLLEPPVSCGNFMSRGNSLVLCQFAFFFYTIWHLCGNNSFLFTSRFPNNIS